MNEPNKLFVGITIDVILKVENGICKFKPVSELAENTFAEIKCAKFGKTLLVAEIMKQSMIDFLVHKRLCVKEEVTQHQNQN